MLRKIYEELVLIRRELQAIKSSKLSYENARVTMGNREIVGRAVNSAVHDTVAKFEKNKNEDLKFGADVRISTKRITAEVFINGEKVKNVHAYTISHEAGKLPVLELKINCAEMNFDSDAIPALPDVYKPFYELKA